MPEYPPKKQSRSIHLRKYLFIALGILLLAEVVISLFSYYQVITTIPPFSWEEALAIAGALIVSNQPVQQLLPPTKDVVAALRAHTLKLLRTGM